jgi:threonine dehydratase
MPTPPTSDMLDRALAVVREHLTPTPVVPLPGYPEVLVKLETLQPTGSFKIRGGLAAVSAYGGTGDPIVTASAGNHGLGMAYAADALGADVTVVVPVTASPAKIAALQGFPVKLVTHGQSYDEAELFALDYAQRHGTFVSAYADPWVIAGQSTVVTELDGQLSGAFTAVIPLGGGGLLAGSVLAAGRTRHPVTLFGVESANSRAVSTAVAAGAITPVEVIDTLADGLAGNLEPGAVTPGIIAGHADLVSVTEESIVDAIRYLQANAGLVVEGSGAVGLAALRSGLIHGNGTVVLPLTGRNIAPALFARLIADQAVTSHAVTGQAVTGQAVTGQA